VKLWGRRVSVTLKGEIVVLGAVPASKDFKENDDGSARDEDSPREADVVVVLDCVPGWSADASGRAGGGGRTLGN
jgi:hypothetical protein